MAINHNTGPTFVGHPCTHLYGYGHHLRALVPAATSACSGTTTSGQAPLSHLPSSTPSLVNSTGLHHQNQLVVAGMAAGMAGELGDFLPGGSCMGPSGPATGAASWVS